MDIEIHQMPENVETENMVIVCGDDDNDDDRKLKPRPPPFLTKTYELVDDPETNSYISWNSSGTGFIIHDHNKFSAHILPNLFKTSNFSSFVYQLNTYGFRKISWERYEYANQWFQAGKKHWLKNIKRRNQQSEWSQSGRKRARSTPDQKSTTSTLETKLDVLITEQNDMKRNIQSLKQCIDSTEGQLTSFKVPEFPELEEEKTNIAVLLKQIVEEFLKRKKGEAGEENSKTSRLGAEGTTEHTENVDIVLSPSDDGLKSSVQDQVVEKTAEKTENCEFWIDLRVEGEAGIDLNGRQGDLVVLHSIPMTEFEEMMASEIVLQQEISVAKPSDLEGDDDDDDDGHLELWA